MKQQPEEQNIRQNFEPGKISKDGFLGEDTRHIHDIIQEDQRTLSRLRLSREDVAKCLQWVIEEGKKGLEGIVDMDDFTIQVRWARGMVPCPFGETGLHHKLLVTVYLKKLRKEITYTQLSVHMIADHGFWGGRASTYRLDPEDVGLLVEVVKNLK